MKGLAEGVIDCIATDHAPHEVASKEVTYEEASFGISVLETALGSLLSLVHAEPHFHEHPGGPPDGGSGPGAGAQL